MAYEHRLYIVQRSEIHSRRKPGAVEIFGQTIAQYNCSRMPAGFYNVFKYMGEEIDFSLYPYDGDTETMTDKYGEHCRMVKPVHVIHYLENLIVDPDESEWHNYRRIAPLLGLLKGLNPEQWESKTDGQVESLWIVNYGY